MSEKPTRVGLLAPMTHELAPLVTMLGLEPRSDDPYTLHDATVDGVAFVATMTGIGMGAATDATHRLLDDGDVDYVIVIGIAGGIEPGQEIGDVLVPEAVLHSGTGATYAPSFSATTTAGRFAAVTTSSPTTPCSPSSSPPGSSRSTWRRPRSRPCVSRAGRSGPCSAPSATARPTASSTPRCGR